MPKPLTVWITTAENYERDGNTRPPDLPLEKFVCRSGSKLELDMEQQTGSTSGKECIKPVYCHPIFNLYAEYFMRNAGLDEAQAGIKIARRNINNLRYEDDTTLMAESEIELRSLLMKVKEESEKVCLKLSIQKTKIMASGPKTSWEIDGELVETVADFFWRGEPLKLL